MRFRADARNEANVQQEQRRRQAVDDLDSRLADLRQRINISRSEEWKHVLKLMAVMAEDCRERASTLDPVKDLTQLARAQGGRESLLAAMNHYMQAAQEYALLEKQKQTMGPATTVA